MALPTEKSVHTTIFLRKLPKRIQKQAILDLCAPFGQLDDVLIFHGRGTALVEFQHLDGINQILQAHNASPLMCAGKFVDIQRAQAEHVDRSENSQKVAKQVQFVMDGIIRQIEQAERMENQRLRLERKEMHLKLLQQLVDQEQRTGHRYSPDVCRKCARSQPWGLAHRRRAEIWQELRAEKQENQKIVEVEQNAKGKKRAREADENDEDEQSDPGEFKQSGEVKNDHSQGDCRTHPIVPLISLTPRQRWYSLDDSFPVVRELRAIKKEINEKLAHLSMSLSNKRCLILDGASANTARALLTRPDRSSVDIIVPNNITETYCSLKASGLATPFYGSVLNYLHHTHYLYYVASTLITDIATTSSSSYSPKSFGLIYLDYCCRLETGASLAEKSPISDICTLFELEFIDPQGCVLAVCLCKPAFDLQEQTSTLPSASSLSLGDVPNARERLASWHLQSLIVHLATQSGLVATVTDSLSYGGPSGNYVLILSIHRAGTQ